jgi:hypothetical protein
MELINLIQKIKCFLFRVSEKVFSLQPCFLFLKESRGQAAITDAIFFLLIVTGLAVFLFSFSATYGNSVNERFAMKYSQDVAIDSIKAILHSSVSRKNFSLYEENEEIYVDSFLALMKEDYTENKSLEDNTKLVLASNVMRVLSPLSPSEDFMFLIYESKTLAYTPFFVLLHLSRDSPDDGGKMHYDFVCSGPQTNFSSVLSSFRNVLISSNQYFTPIKLFEVNDFNPGTVRSGQVNGVVLLSLWKGYPFCYLVNEVDNDGKCNEISSWSNPVFTLESWNCKKLVLSNGVYEIQDW